MYVGDFPLTVLVETTPLTFDSALEPVRGLRSGSGQPRVLIFTAAHLSLELEVMADHVVGQIIPPGPGEVVVETPDGEQAAALLDGQVERRDGQQLLVRYSDAAALNARLVGAGLRVSLISPQQRTLEDIVLAVTGTGSDQIGGTA